MKKKSFQNKLYHLKELVELLRSSVSRGASRASYVPDAPSRLTPPPWAIQPHLGEDTMGPLF